MAILESLAESGSLLTMATTHHGELKTLKYRCKFVLTIFMDHPSCFKEYVNFFFSLHLFAAIPPLKMLAWSLMTST